MPIKNPLEPYELSKKPEIYIDRKELRLAHDYNKYNSIDKIEIAVRDAKKRDKNRNIVRIDPRTVEDFDPLEDNIIGLFGKTVSVGIAKPIYVQFDDLRFVRINSLLRLNTGTEINGNIKIFKVKPRIAQRVIIKCQHEKFRLKFSYKTFIMRKLINHPVTYHDLVSIPILGRGMVFKVVNLRPYGICMIDRETELIVLNYSENI